LDGQGNPKAVFIFQIASTLITASASNVRLINDAQACNVFWQVGSSATLGTTSSFKGTIMALTSISVTTGAVVEGRALARNGQVSLDNNTFTTPGCATTSTAPPTTGATAPAGGVPASAPASGATNPASGPTNPASGTPELPVTGVRPLSGELLGLSAFLLILGALLLVVGRTRALPRRQQ
jgi:type VI secretion system secreted protein VgrG